MNKVAILSPENSRIVKKFSDCGFEIINTQCVSEFISYEQYHADIQCLIIDDNAFVLKCCDYLTKQLSKYKNVIICGENINRKYPYNIALNACVIGKNLIGNLKYIDEKVINFCKYKGYNFINVKQGYTACSCLKIGDRALITADLSICKALKNTDIEVLLIEQGSINLKGANYGFIGGASGVYKDKIYFFGDLAAHKNYNEISKFILDHHFQIVNMIENKNLIDIGGALFC